MIERFRRWRRYRRALGVMVAGRLAAGYQVSALVYERMRDEARARVR